jgi:hypothetical protein
VNDETRAQDAGSESPVKTTTAIFAQVDRVAGYSEAAERNDHWWYFLGVNAGIELGRKQVLDELEADWIERRQTESLVPTGETGPDGLPIYVLRLGAPNVNSPTFAELQRRRGVA